MRNLDYVFIIVLIFMGYSVWSSLDMHRMNLDLWEYQQDHNKAQADLIGEAFDQLHIISGVLVK